MLAAALLALLWANSPFASLYASLLATPLPLALGPLQLDKTAALWVNDALMSLFFLGVGIEIKHEMRAGSLTRFREALLPVAAALGGMLVPAVLFALIASSQPGALAGWAIPCATDIAFSMVVLRLIAPGLPASLPVFLLALAVIDDLGAIVVIALFYTAELSPLALALASLPLLALLLLNRAGVQARWPYLLAGALLWLCVLKSGVHATIAGVIVGMSMPVATGAAVDRALKPWVSFAILPLFALFNAGVGLAGGVAAFGAPLPLAIAVALVAGKLAGVLLGMLAACRFAGATLPRGSDWGQALGVAAVAGIGFTMSLFIASLAFERSAPALFEQAKLGVLAGSLVATLLATGIFRFIRTINK